MPGRLDTVPWNATMLARSTASVRSAKPIYDILFTFPCSFLFFLSHDSATSISRAESQIGVTVPNTSSSLVEALFFLILLAASTSAIAPTWL